MSISVKRFRGKVLFYYQKSVLKNILIILVCFLLILFIYLFKFYDLSNDEDILKIIIGVLGIIYGVYYLFKKWALVKDNNSNLLIYGDDKIHLDDVVGFFYENKGLGVRSIFNSGRKYQVYFKTKYGDVINVFPEFPEFDIIEALFAELEKEGFKVELEEKKFETQDNKDMNDELIKAKKEIDFMGNEFGEETAHGGNNKK